MVFYVYHFVIVIVNVFVTRFTRRVPLVEQELLTYRRTGVHPRFLVRVRVTRSLVLCVCFVDNCLSFCTLSFVFIMLSVLIRLTDSDYPFCNFKLFLSESNENTVLKFEY